MANLIQWFQQLRFDRLWELLIPVAASLLCITVHEVCHGWTACLLGDPTAKRMGRLSFNPIRHIDPLGLILMVTVHFGWAKPVPINPRYFKNYKGGMALTALAGPVSNVLLALVAMMIYFALLPLRIRLGSPQWLAYLELFFNYVWLLSICLAVFNIIPFPPLDGSKVLFAFLPDKAYVWLMRVERYGMLILMVLLWSGVLDSALTAMQTWLTDLLLPIGQWPLSLYLHFHT